MVILLQILPFEREIKRLKMVAFFFQYALLAGKGLSYLIITERSIKHDTLNQYCFNGPTLGRCVCWDGGCTWTQRWPAFGVSLVFKNYLQSSAAIHTTIAKKIKLHTSSWE